METNTDTIAVYRELQELAGRYFTGIPVSRLEASYRVVFDKPLDYQSLGVSNIDQLLAKMSDMVAVFEVRKSNMRYVMPARMVEIRQQLFLKDYVQNLLDRHSGEIEFNCFEDLYKDHYKMRLDYRYYGLTDLEKLCEIFKDILVVVREPSGPKVIKAVKGMPYNLRKRKGRNE